ncbi:MAG: acyl--CoA ligase [Clostridia bacterium]|nr:acyl--CoA ligase [Clostridia bacterium]
MKREKSIWYNYQNPEKWIPEYPECSFYEHFRSGAERYPGLVALEFQGKKYTYKQLIENIEKTACALVALGIGKGDCISIVTPNTPQALFMIYAANRIGAVANMIHPLLSAKEIQEFVENTDSAAILTLDMIYPKFAKISWKTSKEPKMILARIADALPLYAKPVYSMKNKLKLTFNPEHDVIYWNDFIAEGKNGNIQLPADDGKADDTAVILYSGGSSGTPKGVMITNMNINSLALHTYDIGGIEDVVGKKSLAVMPLFHGFGLVICVHAMLSLGFHVYLLPKYDFNECSRLIFKKKINCIYGVPGLFEALIRSEYIDKVDLSFMKLLVCGGDKLPEKLQKRVNRLLKKGGADVVLREAYGQTECVAGCSINPEFDTRIGSAGIAYPDVYFKIVKPGTQQELPDGEDGELCVAGPLVMKGYYKNKEATEKALQQHADGRLWLHTGDMFSKDKDGYIYFRQRNSRMIICGGYNVYATQVEEAINSCPAVAQSCVVGVKDRIYGQKIAAFVVLNNNDADKAAVKEKITECCKNNLSEYSIPHEIIFRQEIPVTNMGKMNYLALEKEINNIKE